MSVEDRLKDLAEIRSMMERSSKFLSLSGLSGVTVGIVGLLAAGFAHWYLSTKGLDIFDRSYRPGENSDGLTILILDGCVSLILAFGLAIFFSTRMAKNKELPIWGPSTKYLLVHLSVPLLTGGLFCLMLLVHGVIYLIPPAMLIFYGLALLNASKFTLNEIRYLGYAQITLGLLASNWVEASLYFWGFGFGVLHIFNGILMYHRYEK